MGDNGKKGEGKLVTPAHGKGKIWQGAPANPVPGTGRPPSAIRQRLRGSFDERVAILEDIADDDDAKPRDRIKALDLLAKYGLGTLQEVSVDDVKDRLSRTLMVIRDNLPEDEALSVLQQIRPIWQ